MASGTGKGAADFLEAGFNSPVKFQNYQPLTAVSTGKLEPVPWWCYFGLKCTWHSVVLVRSCCASYCRSVCSVLGATCAVIYLYFFFLLLIPLEAERWVSVIELVKLKAKQAKVLQGMGGFNSVMMKVLF